MSYSVTFFFFKYCAVYEIMWKEFSRAGQATDKKKWRMRFACSIAKATNTHSDCVILIAFPLQQRLHERSTMLRFT